MSGTRAHMAIVVIGIVGLGIMGFMMKVALESSPGVVAQGKVKRAIVEAYTARGIREVSVRNLPRGEGYEVRAVFADLERRDSADLGRELALLFVEKFTGRRRNTLRVAVLEKGGWGCAGSEVVHEEDYWVPKLLREIQIDHALATLLGAVHEASGLRVTEARREGDSAVVEIAAPPSASDAGGDPEGTSGGDGPDASAALGEAARELVVEALRGVPLRRVDVVLRSTGEPPVELARLTLDSQSLRARKVHRGLPRIQRPRVFDRPPGGDDEAAERGE